MVEEQWEDKEEEEEEEKEEEEEEEEEEKEEDNEGRGKRVVKTSSVLRMGRKCLIAVRGSSRRWRNWFRSAYCREKMNGPWR